MHTHTNDHDATHLTCVSPAILASTERSLSRWPPSVVCVGARTRFATPLALAWVLPSPTGNQMALGVSGKAEKERYHVPLSIPFALFLSLGWLCRCFIVPFCGWKYRSVCRKMEEGVSTGYMNKGD